MDMLAFVARTGAIDPDDVPLHERAARLHKDKMAWILAEEKELAKMVAMDVYELVPRPNGKNVMKTKMAYRIKTDANGLCTEWKARYVCKGFSGKYGEDYTHTFSPTPEPKAFKLLCALLAQGPEWEGEQCDVSAAFLNAKVTNEVYCEQPMFQRQVGKENHVWRLKKQLYGMKNSSLGWYNELRATLDTCGFIPSPSEPCLFTCKRGKTVCHLLIHVDDMVFIHNSKLLFAEIMGKLRSKYDFSSKGPLQWFLGIKIEREAKTGNVLLSQTAYIDTLIRRFGEHMGESTKRVRTPFLVGQEGKLSLAMCPKTAHET